MSTNDEKQTATPAEHRESELAYRFGLAQGTAMRNGHREEAERLLALYNRRAEIKAKLYLLGWKLNEHGWYRPFDNGQVTGVHWGWTAAACSEGIIEPEDAALVIRHGLRPRAVIAGVER